jgi:hypothetical protein
MTNKEAQITINAIKFMIDHAQYSDDVEEALNMAINVLTAQSETHSCDLIDRRALMKEFSDFVRASNNSDFARTPTWNDAVSLVKSMPLAQPSSSCAHENVQDLQPTCNNLATDCISRQAVRYKLAALVNEFEEILSHIREREVNDSVCGLCEYDGAYIGQSGDWCNECPGFEKDDCFKLKEKYRKEWTDING